MQKRIGERFYYRIAIVSGIIDGVIRGNDDGGKGVTGREYRAPDSGNGKRDVYGYEGVAGMEGILSDGSN